MYHRCIARLVIVFFFCLGSHFEIQFLSTWAEISYLGVQKNSNAHPHLFCYRIFECEWKQKKNWIPTVHIIEWSYTDTSFSSYFSLELFINLSRIRCHTFLITFSYELYVFWYGWKQYVFILKKNLFHCVWLLGSQQNLIYIHAYSI